MYVFTGRPCFTPVFLPFLPKNELLKEVYTEVCMYLQVGRVLRSFLPFLPKNELLKQVHTEVCMYLQVGLVLRPFFTLFA
jgi:hypothetical protein